MATIRIETDLDVVSKQRLLVEDALRPDSVYIRMKETLIDLYVSIKAYMVQYKYL